MKRFAKYFVPLALLTAACSSSPESTSTETEASDIAPSFVQWTITYVGTFAPQTILWRGASGTSYPVLPSQYYCAWQGTQDAFVPNESVSINPASTGWTLAAVTNAGLVGVRTAYVACRLLSTLTSEPGSKVIGSTVTLSARQGQTLSQTILSDPSGKAWCTLRGMSGTTATTSDVCSVALHSGSWTLVTGASSGDRTCEAGCITFQTAPLIEYSSGVSPTVHSASNTVGAGLCGISTLFSGMGSLTSAVQILSNDGALVNRLGTGASWPYASSSCLFQSPE